MTLQVRAARGVRPAELHQPEAGQQARHDREEGLLEPPLPRRRQGPARRRQGEEGDGGVGRGEG